MKNDVPVEPVNEALNEESLSSARRSMLTEAGSRAGLPLPFETSSP